ncbi:oxidoreductase [Nesterenkonia halotolerans]|uniref:NAD(P)-dependent dehydrogenase (Short-subunit alcohol dehydrogenase family) n=1 Tax=Nesterenkonia halotolerans TaxID=225325 RepID=A0ABR9J741_9MICC|nr:oxidoreductase [Nesterenkonia halotolerans]MBE1514822.1 NAD(P)-dependent dehydrogenase (short-subunit alcohol dehydrogenase family) [Nesterenkonia halotolerans]
MTSTQPVALVTGASSGIGAATARRLAAAGYLVYGAARRADRLEELRGDGVLPLVVDLLEEASLTTAVEHIRAEAGRLDVLVNNAGYGEFGAVEDVPIAQARRQFEVNLFGLARLVQLSLPLMRAQGGGTIINISSVAGRVAGPLGAWYHASKFALEGFSDSLRQELAPFGVRVVVVQPGAIRTEWGAHALDSARDASGAGRYSRRVDGLARGILNPHGTQRRASSPEVIAAVIERAAKARRPRTRYALGHMARVGLTARRLLSDRLMDQATSRLMG